MVKILIVDDISVIRMSMKHVLEREKFFVLEADSGSLALRVMAQERPQVISIDIGLPDMTGIELLEKMVAQNASLGYYPKYILVSGQCTYDNVKKAMELGVKRILTKPFDYDYYARVIKDIANESAVG